MDLCWQNWFSDLGQKLFDESDKWRVSVLERCEKLKKYFLKDPNSPGVAGKKERKNLF